MAASMDLDGNRFVDRRIDSAQKRSDVTAISSLEIGPIVGLMYPGVKILLDPPENSGLEKDKGGRFVEYFDVVAMDC